jgi:hypothetical protein
LHLGVLGPAWLRFTLSNTTSITHEELIQKAVAEAKRAGITEKVERPRLREAALIYFDTRGPDGNYKVLVDLHTGELMIEYDNAS